jgi:plasmid stability protein
LFRVAALSWRLRRRRFGCRMHVPLWWHGATCRRCNMAENRVKLTVRLPAHLHRALRERAAEYHISLNEAVVDTLAAELAPAPQAESEGERFDRMLRESGLLVELGPEWDALIGDESEIPSVEEVREMLRGIPLSDWIIEDRGPR